MWGHQGTGLGAAIYRQSRVGINQANPLYQLDVNGDFHVSAGVQFDAALDVNGAVQFNNTLDDNFFKPVAKAWREVPDFPRKPLSNLATTAKTPISLANAILQLNRESMGNYICNSRHQPIGVRGFLNFFGQT